MKFMTYFVVSGLLTTGLLAYAVHTKQQYYPTVLFLVSSKVSLVILLNMALCLTGLAGRLLKTLFLGQLRTTEVEMLYDNAKFAITETLLVLTIFREELNVRVFGLLVALFFAKVFHWLANARVEHLEQVGMVTRMQHVRIVLLTCTLIMVDCFVAKNALEHFLEYGASVRILFGFEFAILLVAALSVLAKYVIQAVDARIDGVWHSKGGYTFLCEFIAEILRFTMYCIFFVIVFVYYGVPLHLFHHVWISLNNLRVKLTSFLRYRRLTANLYERFPDATDEQLQECGHICVICREHMDVGKVLNCDHIFHLECLRSWLQHQQTCPICRSEIPVNQAPHNTPMAAAAAAAARARAQAQARGVVPDAAAPAGQEDVGGAAANAGGPAAAAAGGNVGDGHTDDTGDDLAQQPLRAALGARPTSSSSQSQGPGQDQQVGAGKRDPSKKKRKKTATTKLVTAAGVTQAVPGFFRVSSAAGSDVHVGPGEASARLRHVPQNTVLFATAMQRAERQDDRSRIWLRITDGWLPAVEVLPFTPPSPSVAAPFVAPPASVSVRVPPKAQTALQSGGDAVESMVSAASPLTLSLPVAASSGATPTPGNQTGTVRVDDEALVQQLVQAQENLATAMASLAQATNALTHVCQNVQDQLKQRRAPERPVSRLVAEHDQKQRQQQQQQPQYYAASPPPAPASSPMAGAPARSMAMSAGAPTLTQAASMDSAARGDDKDKEQTVARSTSVGARGSSDGNESKRAADLTRHTSET